MDNYQIDNLDRGILEALMANARTAYAELAKQFGVSPGTIHVRVEKMKPGGNNYRRAHRHQPEAARLRCLLLYRHYSEKRQRLSFRPHQAGEPG